MIRYPSRSKSARCWSVITMPSYGTTARSPAPARTTDSPIIVGMGIASLTKETGGKTEGGTGQAGHGPPASRAAGRGPARSHQRRSRGPQPRQVILVLTADGDPAQGTAERTPPHGLRPGSRRTGRATAAGPNNTTSPKGRQQPRSRPLSQATPRHCAAGPDPAGHAATRNDPSNRNRRTDGGLADPLKRVAIGANLVRLERVADDQVPIPLELRSLVRRRQHHGISGFPHQSSRFLCAPDG